MYVFSTIDLFGALEQFWQTKCNTLRIIQIQIECKMRCIYDDLQRWVRTDAILGCDVFFTLKLEQMRAARSPCHMRDGHQIWLAEGWAWAFSFLYS